MQTLAVLPPTPINFEIKHFDTAVWVPLSSTPELSSHVNVELFNSYNNTQKLENRLQTDKKTDWLKGIQMDTKTKKKPKNPALSLVNAGSSDRVFVLSTKCGGFQPNGHIVASSHMMMIKRTERSEGGSSKAT